MEQEVLAILDKYAKGLHLSRSRAVEIAIRYMAGEQGDRMTRRIVELARQELNRKEG